MGTTLSNWTRRRNPRRSRRSLARFPRFTGMLTFRTKRARRAFSPRDSKRLRLAARRQEEKKPDEATEARQDPSRGRRSDHHQDRDPAQGQRKRKPGLAERLKEITGKPYASREDRSRLRRCDGLQFQELLRRGRRRHSRPASLHRTRNRSGCPPLRGWTYFDSRTEGHSPGTSRSGRQAGQGLQGRPRSHSDRRETTRPTTRSSPETAWSWGGTMWSRRPSSSTVWPLPMQTVINSMMQESSLLQSLQTASPQNHDAILRDLVEFWIQEMKCPEGAKLDEQTLREALIKRLQIKPDKK